MIRLTPSFSLMLLLLVSCKMLPNTIRSSTKSSEVLNMLDESSIRFKRSVTGTGGDFSFRLRDRYNCRIEYWADDLNGRPSPKSPMALDCPNDGKATELNFAIDNITPTITISFRILVWPRTVSYLTNFAYVYRENKNTGNIKTNHMIVSRYIVPRNSNEIYTFQFPNNQSLGDVKAVLQSNYAKNSGSCVESAGDSDQAFPRNRSVEDGQKRPLHGLDKVSTDGFGQGNASSHPVFSNRLTLFYDDVDRQQNWKWNFNWEGQTYDFELYPPGYMASVNLVDGSTVTSVKNRELGNTLTTIPVGSRPFTINTSIVYPTQLSNYQLVIKSLDASKTILRCDFSIDQENIMIPSSSYQKLTVGEYLVTLVLETNQIQATEGSNYPPWIVTAQDWVSFKINKKL